MISKQKLAILALTTCFLAGAITAHVRLFNPSNKKKLYWKNPANISIVLDTAGSADILDDSEDAAMRLGMRAWNADPGSKGQMIETTYPITNKCSDWLSSAVHLIFFDETNCSGFFPFGSGTVAVTPVWFNSKGRVLDADVIFNGMGFTFTTTGDPGAFDVQDVGTHELGHLLGLDHSGWTGATMYPYVDEGLIFQRSLSLDDTHGLRHAYPEGSSGRIDGKVRRLVDSSGVAGAHVSVVDASGRSAGGALADDGGNFSIIGLDAGTYTVQANPLDSTVTSGNLQRGRTIETDFEATVGPTTALNAGQTLSVADILVDADVTLTLGTAFDELPLEARAGAVVPHTLTGAALTIGSTLTCSDPNIVIGGVVWSTSSVSFTVSTPALAAPGHADLIAVNGTDRTVLVAALEIVPPDPTVTGISPVKGNDIGGTAVTITGTGFRAGASVVIGDTIYTDGVGDCTVVDSTTITLTTDSSALGLHDVVVMDESGVEGRDTSAFTVASIPIVDSRFPISGDAAGGTELVISGQNFQPGMTVRIDGVLQAAPTLEGATIARVTTSAGVAGGPYTLEVQNPSAETATSAFTYVNQADPSLVSLNPGSGKPAGGKVITLTGSGFDANTTVMFGVDPLTGAGGIPGTGTVLVDASTLQVTTPPMTQGRVAVMVQSFVTGQASILPDSFNFTAGSGGGGGGGCYMVPADGSGGGRPNPLLGALGLAFMMAMVWGYARRTRRRAMARI